ncbi:MAG: hypothetical protein QOE93_892 [Actinomycetota bacterium]|jgi:hypothetical protein|nr:hypothetical protein [Actinomycetota bacterium]
MGVPQIDAVLTRIDSVVVEARARRLRTGFFAAMYRQTTKTVGREVEAGAFDDAERMARFVAMFAGRYLDAVGLWQAGQQPTRSWRVAFRAADRRDRVILQHLLLGMNAHINLDLAVVAATICPGDSIFELKDDFGRINDVLQRLMVPLQKTIGRFSPLLHVLWQVGGDVDDEVLNFSIRVARRDAWQQAVTLAHLDDERRALAIDSLDRKVAVLGRLVDQPGGVLEKAVDVVGYLESDDIVAITDALLRVEPTPRPGPG